MYSEQLHGKSSVKSLAAGVFNLFQGKRGKYWDSYFKTLLEKEISAFKERWNNCQPSSNEAINTFDRIKTLGTGGFGRVMLVRNKESKEYYAMKILKKERVVAMRQVEHTINEKRILFSLSYPFMVKLISSCKDNSYLYLVLEFVNGGELFTLLRKLKRFPEAMVQFYSAQVVLAFEYLHSVDIVYRDLKPENLLIDSKGYLKVTDFGLAKMIKGNRTYTMCGTPEYLAPEIIQSKGYGKGVDWWATGILIYEMMAGQVPFYAANHMVMYAKIVRGVFRMPMNFSEKLRDLLTHLIAIDWTQRYGCTKNGIADIKGHKWYAGVDWIALFERRLPAPYIPTCREAGDSSNFEDYEEEAMEFSHRYEYGAEFAEF